MKDDIEFVRKEEVELEKLSVQYIPYLTPIRMWHDTMALATSPHVELMQTFRDKGFDYKSILKSRYYEERKRRYDIGMKRWTEKKILEHIRKRYFVFVSIRYNGYSAKKCKDKPIIVLEKPFWNTRFGMNALEGMEIWNGAGRCSAAYALGHKTIPVHIYKDTQPGTHIKGRFEDKLKEIPGIQW